MHTPARSGASSITFAVHMDFVRAISAAAAERGMTRSTLIRKVIGDFLREAGHLAAEAPTTQQAARWARTH